MRKGMQIAYQGLNVVVRLLPCIGLGWQPGLAVACGGACDGRPHYCSLRMCNKLMVGLLLVVRFLCG